MAERTRIALIGAGSVEFTRTVLSDLLASPELHGRLAFSLHDIDAERLDTAERMARYIDETTGAGATVEAHAERRAALDGADYAVNEIQVGGYAATRLDFDIPRKYGLRQTIGDTIGIGGIFRGLRTIPVELGIAGDMTEVCPDAWLLNYTNPMAMLPWAVREGTSLRNCVGLCHSVKNTHGQLAEIVGVPQEEITFLTAGFNHQAWVMRFERNGQSLYPLLDQKLAADPEGLGRRVRMELYRRFGYFPTESGEHSSEYVPWFIHFDDEVERYRIFIDDYLYRSEENLGEYDAIKRALDAGDGFEIRQWWELASELIHSRMTGTSREIYVNVINEGLIDNLPQGCCVEVPADVDSEGLRPKAVGALPPQCAAVNRTFLNVVELTVRAALEQRRDLVYAAAYLDPNCSATLRLSEIQAMCDELIEAHGDALPEGIRRG